MYNNEALKNLYLVTTGEKGVLKQMSVSYLKKKLYLPNLNFKRVDQFLKQSALGITGERLCCPVFWQRMRKKKKASKQPSIFRTVLNALFCNIMFHK